MIKPLEQKKRQQILLIIGAGILIIAVVVLYFGFWKKGPSLEPATKPGVDLAESGVEIELNFDFLNETILPFLRIYGDIPVEKGTTGRDNPFIPY